MPRTATTTKPKTKMKKSTREAISAAMIAHHAKKRRKVGRPATKKKTARR